MKNSYNSISKKKKILTIQLKMGRGPKQTFFLIRLTDGHQTHEEMLNITNPHGNENQNHNEIQPHICQSNCHQEDNK